MAWYAAGTVSGTNGTKIVTGVGTQFNLYANAGDMFTVDRDTVYEIDTVDSATQITLKTNLSAGFSASAYNIIPLGLMNLSTTDLANRVSTLLTKWQQREAAYANWNAGTASGVATDPINGTVQDAVGNYPLYNALGTTVWVPCPAKQQSLLNATYIKEGATSNYRSASTTPGANTVPILDANKALVLPTGGFLQGDFSNATPASRTLIQTSTANATTIATLAPSGTGTTAGVEAYASSAAVNCEVLEMRINSGSALAYINSKKVGTGTARPLAFMIDGVESFRVNTYGNLAIGHVGTASNVLLSIQKTLAIADSVGIQSILTQSVAGTTNTVGGDFRSIVGHSSGSVPNVYGVFTRASATVTGGSITNLVGVFSQITTSNSPTVTNAYGFQVLDISAGATQTVGYYSGIQTGTGKWSIYSVGTAHSYHAGNLLVGGSTESGNAEKVQVWGAILGRSAASGLNLDLVRDYTGSTLPSLGQAVGLVRFGAINATGNATVVGARLWACASQAWVASTAQGTHLIFETTADNATTQAEKMRLSSAGELLVGSATAISAGYPLQAKYDVDSHTGAVIKNGSAGTSASARVVLDNGTNTLNIIHYGVNHATLANVSYLHTSSANGILAFGPGSSEKARLTAAGRLLVGTTTENTTTGAAKIQSTDGIYLGNSANSAANVLDWYEEASFTLTATGMTTSPTGTATSTRVGNVVTLNVPAVSGTSNATAFTLTGLPTNMRPASNKEVLARVKDNSAGSFSEGLITVGTDGTLYLYPTINGGTWTASGTKAVGTLSVSYTLV